jgi:murein DD-endopeptidase MepM/ murein hydrolase activator NlpD
MKRLLVCILLFFLVSGCKATSVIPPTAWPSPLPTVQGQAPVITRAFPTALHAPTSTSASVSCDASEKTCTEEGHFLLDRPIALPGTDTIDRGYPYGSTAGGIREPHHGVEFYDPGGTPVLAAADGLVIFAGDDSQTRLGPRLNFYGNIIVLEHHFLGNPRLVYTLYGHLSKIEVQTGQTVQSGEKIGEVGATGEATGSHLHFEVRVGDNKYDSTRNPVLWLKPLTGEDGASYGVIAGRLVNAAGKTLYTANINIQYFLDAHQPQSAAFQVDTYLPGNQAVMGEELWNENFALGDIPAGNYRLSLMWNGVLYERWVVVVPGKLTFVVFTIGK